MFEKIAALDIGTSAIKLVTVKTSLKDFEVTSFSYEDIDQGIESQEEAIRDALARLVKEINLNDYKVFINLPIEKSIIRNISFPFADIEKIAEAIPYEAEENIPFKLDDLVMDFQKLKSNKPEECRILLAATHKETMYDFLRIINEFKILPVKMGLESNALFECYRYFNKIENESVVQIDIGNNKTIINIIQNNNLLNTRCISIGVNLIYEAVAEILKKNNSEAIRIFNNLNLDLTSFENNLNREYYKLAKINKATLKKIYGETTAVIEQLIEQIALTVKSFTTSFENIEFNRILMSGGGANLIGIGTVISKDFELPVVSLPFLENYEEEKIKTQFPIAFGTILAYLNKKTSVINFLKGDFVPDIVSESKKIYYLSGAFLALTGFVLVIFFIISFLIKLEINRNYDKILKERFQKYFSMQAKEDPVGEAMKILAKEKKELDDLEKIINPGYRILDILKDTISQYQKDDSFELHNLMINEGTIRIDGTVDSMDKIDEFKNKLNNLKKFESVSLSSNLYIKNRVRFTMTIKIKSLSKPKTSEQKGNK